MSNRTVITASKAPAAVGPYSHAVRQGSLLYCSGMLPIDPESGATIDSSVGAEVTQCMRNLAAVCEAGGTSLLQTVRTTIYTTKLDQLEEINSAYGGFFPHSPPARVAVGVAALPKGVRVEIDAIVGVK